ncbi:MAG: hypothetical protein R6W77_01135 [Trueperaceae bacterium]
MDHRGREDRTIGVFYEHLEWFEAMFAEFDRRGVAYERLLANRHGFDPGERESPYALLFNRMSPSAFARGHGHAIHYTLDYLAHLESIGANVLNGYRPYTYEFSKARQLGLLARLDVRCPRTRVINHVAQTVVAAQQLSYPLVVKPNIGGSGAGIRKFDDDAELRAAAEAGEIDLGLDGTALVQEYHTPREGSIVRVEVLDGRFLYAIKLHLQSPDSFNLCPADYCQVPQAGLGVAAQGAADGVSGRGVPVEGFTPTAEAIATVQRITAAAGIEVGGVEYLVSERDGERYYYDINALSNFVADAPNVVGFDPVPLLVDFVMVRAGLLQTATLATVTG